MTRARWASWRIVAAAVLAASLLAGCGPSRKGSLTFAMQVLEAQKPFAETVKAFDSTPEKLPCEVSEGPDTVYSLTRYQWARLNALAMRGEEVRRVYRNRFLLDPSEEFKQSVTTSTGRTIDAALTIVPDSCCTFTMSNVTFRLADGETPGPAVTFWSMYPQINNILVELPPAAAGGPSTWILVDIEELEHAGPNMLP